LSCLSGALPCSAYAAVSRVGRLSTYTPSGVWPSSARRGADGLVGVPIDRLVFDAFPESFHDHGVAPAALPIHADLDTVVFQQPGEFEAGELTALIGVELSGAP